MSLSIDAWHQRYQTQASWTRSVREHILQEYYSRSPNRVLDLGCGTGALIDDFRFIPPENIYGLDISLDNLKFAQTEYPLTGFTAGDAHFLPFHDDAFDFAFCHYVLMWVDNPAAVISEMIRVTQKGGIICAFAEPDYGGRIDYPEVLTKLGFLQEAALIRQGADPRMGRKLSGLLYTAGLSDINVGVIGANWRENASENDSESEWQMLINDLEGHVPKNEIKQMREIDIEARMDQSRILYVPTFFAYGRVK